MVIKGNSIGIVASVGLVVSRLGNVQERFHFLRRGTLGLIILSILFFLCSCSKHEACLKAETDIFVSEINIKVESLYYENHNEIIIGIDKFKNQKRLAYWGFSPHIQQIVKIGDVLIKNKNSKFFCAINKERYSIFYLDCNNVEKPTRLYEFEKRIVINLNANYYIDSTGLYLVDTLQ